MSNQCFHSADIFGHATSEVCLWVTSMVFRTGLQQSLHAFVTTKKDADWLLNAKIRWKCFRLDVDKMDV